jgi:WD40 repeat protein
MFASKSFPGHKDMVLDIAMKSQSPNIAATSSEDNTIRLWDTRIGRTIQCVTGFGDIPAENILFSPADENILFGSTERGLLQFDLRCDTLINREHAVIYAQDSESDICCFDINPKADVVSIGCDDGSALIINRMNGNVTKRMSRVHSNMLGVVAFAPRNPSILVTGGFDSMCCAWDTTRGRPVGEAIDFSAMDSEAARESSASSQISNPPFVHDILYLSDGRTAVFALGDGSLRLLNTCNGPLSLVSSVVEAHSGMVSCLCPWSGCAAPGESAPTPMDAFLSCGLDRNIIAWAVTDVAGSGGEDSGRVVSSGGGKRSKKGKRENSARSASAPRRRVDLTQLFTIEHPHKINSIASTTSITGDSAANSEGGDKPSCCSSSMPIEGGSIIGVADVTSNWTMYTIRS